MNEELKTIASVLLAAFVIGAAWTIGCYVASAGWTVLKNTLTNRQSARDLAAANAIMDSWAKMPNRDSHGRFTKKDKRL